MLLLSCNVTNIATMSKSTTIDLSGYITQAEYCRINGIELNNLSQWIKRMKDGKSVPDHAKNIQFMFVPELKMTLVKK